ncbi:uncharacterized protein I303_101102 [Kwoniella dejecticola CBS 10117]|uniref:Uncharacterized protein n=1 Tax=Kwoniella dejecticola CBS 10117 TaxID=1296121 RepID=A0A1A6AGU1_9TREE|nr:uncharacterized protein I303_01106 [Kwoniella dejecticola CBS 10117]OBR89281.1 hypothetical protein I303_01106 [Kwoniella dejecticola CBS 10117]
MRFLIFSTILCYPLIAVKAGCSNPHEAGGHLAFYCQDEVTKIDFEYWDGTDKYRELHDQGEVDVGQVVYEEYYKNAYGAQGAEEGYVQEGDSDVVDVNEAEGV